MWTWLIIGFFVFWGIIGLIHTWYETPDPTKKQANMRVFVDGKELKCLGEIKRVNDVV